MGNTKPTYRYDALTGFWGIPNIDCQMNFTEHEYGKFLVRHNQFGNRDDSVNRDLEEKNFICIGGSHTWGAYVEQDERYNDFLTALLGRRFLNMGHPSFGLDQICLAIEHKCSEFNPEGIVVEQYPWAFHRILNSYVNGYLKPYYYLRSNGDLEYVSLSPLAQFRSYRKIVGEYRLFKKEFLENRNNINLKENYEPENDPVFLLWKKKHYEYAYELYGKIARKIKDYCDEKGIKFLIFLTAHLQHFFPKSDCDLIDYNLPSKKLEIVLKKHDVPYVNFSSKLINEQKDGQNVIFPDGHLNPHGHRMVAECLSKELKNRRWV